MIFKFIVFLAYVISLFSVRRNCLFFNDFFGFFNDVQFGTWKMFLKFSLLKFHNFRFMVCTFVNKVVHMWKFTFFFYFSSSQFSLKNICFRPCWVVIMHISYYYNDMNFRFWFCFGIGSVKYSHFQYFATFFLMIILTCCWFAINANAIEAFHINEKVK